MDTKISQNRVALILQGGGALGAYQAGVYEALHHAGLEPDWISGVSIGAINGAIVAGNPPDRRLSRLRAFWEQVTGRNDWPWRPADDMLRQARNIWSALQTVTLGQPGFFGPSWPGPLLAPPGTAQATSLYDTAPLRETLLRLIDFDLLNQGGVRFAAGATNGFAWPAELLEDADGITMTFPDIPGAITWGQARSEALARASDALVSVLASMVEDGQAIPLASAADGRPMVSVAPLDAAKVALHATMLAKGVSNVQLGRLMGLDEKAIRRLRDPLHGSRIENVDSALHILGRRLEVLVFEGA